MTVPLYDTPTSFDLARPTPESIHWFGSVVTFWRHFSADICERVRTQVFARIWLHEAVIVPGFAPQAVVVAER